MAVILFIDMLGGRRRWQDGGVDEAMKAFYRFKSSVNTAARRAPAGELLDGVIETDAAMLVCRSTVEATRIARRLYLGAFTTGHLHPSTPRSWYRGCIVPHYEGDFLRAGAQLRDPVNEVTAFRYSDSALQAVAVEKSGFKGMRLLVDSALVTGAVQQATKIPFDTHTLIPFRKLKYSHYPQTVKDQYSDFLWMAGESEEEWHNLELRMTSRLRYSSGDPEELAQAAATQILFHECAAIRQSVIGRAKRQKEREGQTEATE
ncbi:MAG: hypothetical protein WEA09_05270 [Gemmatimonadota bacterium]